MNKSLSKSKLMAWRQCPRRLWLVLNRPALLEESAATQAAYRTGNEIGELARAIYDPRGTGVLVNAQVDGYPVAQAQTEQAMQAGKPVFEAVLAGQGVLALADVLLPVRRSGKRAWRMVEVKSATKVKSHYSDDVAVQAYAAKAAGVPLASVALATVDSSWVYQGDGNYQGLLAETDMTHEATSRSAEIAGWVEQASKVARKRLEPVCSTGPHCKKPHACGFAAHCQESEPPVIATSRKRSFDSAATTAALAPYGLPACFMDFETFASAVPWIKGMRPYQKMPFQFSVHKMGRGGKLTPYQFLDLSGKDPRPAFARDLLAACGDAGPIYVYNQSFEGGVLQELAKRLPRQAAALIRLRSRMVDLLPIAKKHYYHPSQNGSWSLKAVLPSIAPDLDYATLDGVHDGGMAMEAYREAIDPVTSPARKAAIERELRAYCERDTLALVRLWQFFTGRVPTA